MRKWCQSVGEAKILLDNMFCMALHFHTMCTSTHWKSAYMTLHPPFHIHLFLSLERRGEHHPKIKTWWWRLIKQGAIFKVFIFTDLNVREDETSINFTSLPIKVQAGHHLGSLVGLHRLGMMSSGTPRWLPNSWLHELSKGRLIDGWLVSCK